MPREDLLANLLDDFVEESTELLQRLHDDLRQLDRWVEKAGGHGRCDPHLLGGMFRAVHTLKGLAGMFDLVEIDRLTHRVEDLFDALRHDRLPLNRRCLELLHQASDRLTAMVRDEPTKAANGRLKTRAISDGPEVRPTVARRDANAGSEKLLAGIESLLATAVEGPGETSREPALVSQKRPTCVPADGALLGLWTRVSPIAPQGRAVVIGRVRVAAGWPLAGLKGLLIHKKLQALGDVFYCSPPVDELVALRDVLLLEFGVATEAARETVEKCINVAGVREVSTLAGSDDRATFSPLAPVLRGERSGGSGVRGDHDICVGAWGSSEANAPDTAPIQLPNESTLLGLPVGQPPATRCALRPLTPAPLPRSTGGEGDVEMSAPFGLLFNRFRRVVSDIAHRNGARIHVVIEGEDMALDKRLIARLRDPLLQLVRNAADHGIEPVAERLAAGKPPRGTIWLADVRERGHVVIRVRDDGRGLDAEQIRERAIRMGLITAQGAARLSRQETLDLVWSPGLSTAESVTQISGRGIGLDIVRERIAALGGRCRLESAPGQGTTFTIEL